jgi:hypothetical protein
MGACFRESLFERAGVCFARTDFRLLGCFGPNNWAGDVAVVLEEAATVALVIESCVLNVVCCAKDQGHVLSLIPAVIISERTSPTKIESGNAEVTRGSH